MSEQPPFRQVPDPDRGAVTAIPASPARPVFSDTWYFNWDLHEYADQREIGAWWAFCIVGESIRGIGFPDLMAYRKDPETGVYDVLAAELKRDEKSELGEEQGQWLDALAGMGITTQVWYGDSPDDLNKLYDILENGTTGYASVTRPPPRTSKPNRIYSWEGFFNNEVNDAAMHHGWRLFHVDGFRVVRGKDFPRWTMFRQSAETGKYEMLVATLRRGASTEQDADEGGWLDAFKQKGVTTQVWRGDYQEDLAELYDILDNGTVGQQSITKLPLLVTSPIPANFGIVLPNTVDLIEGDEMTTGDKASLRRMDPTNPNSAAFWKLMSQRGMDGVDVRKWGLITHGIALMAHGAGVAHRARTPVGRTLYLGGEQQPGERGFYSEDRLATLLAARGPALHRLLARLFRLLANEGCAFNWREMAWFILNEGYNEEQAEQSRIRIAREYYRAERRGSQSSAE